MNSTERFEKVPIDKLIGYARNARIHSKSQILQLRASLREYGAVSPALIDKDYTIIAGHGRIEAAREEGFTEFPCVFVEHLTEAQKRAYTISDNQLALNAGWDEEMLAVELSDLQSSAFDLSILGFNDTELNKLLGSANDVEEDGFDLTAALEKASFVKRGDIWTLGRHRLMCGDATDPLDVAALMAGQKANLALTDPPYAVSFKSASGLSIMNDNLKPDEFYKFLLASFKNMADALEPDGSVYVFHSDGEGLTFRRAFEDAGFKLSCTCVWVKNSFVLGRTPYQYAHEPILFGWKKKGSHKWYKGRSERTVWNFDKPRKNENHPNSKPVELMAYPIQNSSQVNGIVLDVFAGSFSVGIACEQCDRICYALELDPKYASVCIRRYVEFSKSPELATVERDGQIYKYEDVAKEVQRTP